MNILKRAALSVLRKDLTELRKKSLSNGDWLKILGEWGVGGKDEIPKPQNGNENKYLESYRDNVWVKTAVSFMGRNLSSVPMIVKALKGDKEEVINNHPALDVFYKPYPGWNYQRYMYFICASLMLAGNFYGLEEKGKASGKTFRIKPLSPARMRVVINETTEEKVGYVYTTLAGSRKAYQLDEILHIQLYNPLDEFWGMPEMAPARLQIENDNGYIKYNNRTLKNNATPPNYIQFPANQEVDTGKLKTFKEWWEQEQKGVEKAGAMGYLTGGGEIKTVPNMSQRDMEYILGAKMLREGIICVTHIPALLLNVLDNASYSNYEVAVKIGWEEALIPMSEIIANGHDPIIMEYDKSMNLWYAQDFSRVEALRENLTPRIEQVNKLWAMGVPFDTAAQFVGLKIDKIPGGDVGYLPYSLQPAGSVAEPEDEETPPEADNEPPETGKRYHGAKKGIKRKGKGITDVIGAEKYLENYITRALKSETAYKKELDGLFDDLIDEVVEIWDKQEKSVTKAAKFELFDEGAFVERKAKMSAKHYGKVAEIEGKIRAEEVNALAGTNFTFNISDPRVGKFIKRQGLANAKLVKDTAKNKVNQIIETAQKEGLGIEEIGTRLNEKLTELKHYETVRIAQTELNSAGNFAADESLKQAEKITGLKLGEEWIASGLDNMRDAHADANGQVVAVGESFDVGGEKLEYPGDPSGSAENVINCHCTIATRIMED